MSEKESSIFLCRWKGSSKLHSLENINIITNFIFLQQIDSCAGDSGMGIIQQIDMKMFQFGLVSHGNRICGAEGSFGVYLNIFNYISWIKSNIS